MTRRNPLTVVHEALTHSIDKGVYKLALFTARRPCTVMASSVLAALVLFSGVFIHVHMETDGEKLWYVCRQTVHGQMECLGIVVCLCAVAANLVWLFISFATVTVSLDHDLQASTKQQGHG